ncbi:MAG: hypothetical protein ACI8WM_003462 [Burkholderiaceae bacterium]|jgi:hypothetical protein
MAAQNIPWNRRLFSALDKVDVGRLSNAFSTNTFVYGTGGTGGMVVRGLAAYFKTASLKVLGRELNLFDPGRRTNAYLKGGKSGPYQMMDLYYGQKGTMVHELRVEAIAEFVHYAMGYTTPFSMQKSGRDEYLAHHQPSVIEGWQGNTPACNIYNGLTATKEISRIIRWGIQQYGGTLIFEGREVYYSQVFKAKPARTSDTDEEARELFRFFTPGAAKAPFGKGTVVFHWGGQVTIPTKLHFASNWKWSSQLYVSAIAKPVWDKSPTSLTAQATAQGKHTGGAFQVKNAAHTYRNLRTQGGKVILVADPDFLPTWNNFLDMPIKLAEQNPASLMEAVETLLGSGGFPLK